MQLKEIDRALRGKLQAQSASEKPARRSLARLRHEVDSFDERLAAYLSSSTGRFEVWLAARRVRTRTP